MMRMHATEIRTPTFTGPAIRLAQAATLATLLALATAPLHAGDPAAKTSASTPSAETKMAVKDAWLDGKLESALLFNEHLNSFAINTDVENGIAYLTGTVESDIDRELAGEVARSVEGITEVENELTVDEMAAQNAQNSETYQQASKWRQSIDNATLTATIKTKLLLNEHTSGLDINVDSMNGVVTLSGTVDSDKEADLAMQIAANVDDTRDVRNRLEVAQSHSG